MSVNQVAAYQGGIEQKLKEDYVADLYIFLAKQYPDVEEKQESSQNEELRGVKAYTVEARDGARTWRDYVPQYLQERGTSQACEALRKIIRELPELKDKLQWRLPEAETLTRRQTWMPYQPEEVLAMICNQSLRTMRTILVLASDPFDKARLRLDREVREIDEGLRRSKYREKFNLEQKWAIRTDDFRKALLDFEPQIVHFCGHGEGNDGLVVEEVTGQPKLVSTEALAGLFALASDHVECVLLNACYSEVQADAIVQHIDYVIGMSKAIGDAAAIKFSIGFYDALGSGQTIETAYKYGCNAIQLESIPEYLTPKLKKKS